MDAVLNCMVSEQVAPGEKNRELSQLLKKMFEAVDVHILRSYPKAVELGLRAFNSKEAAVSVLAPGCYVYAAEAAGTKLVCCDVLPAILCADPENIRPEADALILHEPFGLFPERELYENLSIPILEDITQSFGSSRNESKPGDIGSIVVMALEEGDMITTGGGAVLIVKERTYSESLQQLVNREGSHLLLPDMNAALGIVQLSFFEEHLKRRREFFELFYKSLLKTRHQAMIELDEQNLSSCFTFPVLLDSDSRSVLKFARKYKVEIELSFEGCVLSMLALDPENYPRSVPYLLRSINFPLYPLLSQDQMKTLVRVLAALP